MQIEQSNVRRFSHSLRLRNVSSLLTNHFLNRVPILGFSRSGKELLQYLSETRTESTAVSVYQQKTEEARYETAVDHKDQSGRAGAWH